MAQTSVCSLNDAYTDWSLCYSATRYRAVVLTSLACGVINDSAKANARDWVRLRRLMSFSADDETRISARPIER